MEQQAAVPVTGAAMDKVIPRNRKQLMHRTLIAMIAIISIGFLVWSFFPKGQQIALSDIRTQVVERGLFLDEIAVRANAQPLNSVILDSVESGRVEEVLARDGAMVKKGELLFRLSNPQRNLDLLQRKGEHTQQISNMANLRVGFQAASTDHQRRLSSLEFELSQLKKKHERNKALAAQGFISTVALEESQDALDRQQFAVNEEKQAQANEQKVRRVALEQMETGINGLQAGLKLVTSNLDALSVRAPIEGKLIDFQLQVGESVATGKRLGRIDDPKAFKLLAPIDEFYLNRIAIGYRGSARLGDKMFPVEVMNVFPQIKDGRFTAELKFIEQHPDKINPGQSFDITITLGDPSPGLVLPMGGYINDTGGSAVFVLSPDEKTAERRAIKLGHRSNRQVQVLNGLKQGEKVIVSSYASYQNSQRLQLSKK